MWGASSGRRRGQIRDGASAVPFFLSAEVERDLHRATPAGIGRVLDRPPELGEGVRSRQQPLQLRRPDKIDRGGEILVLVGVAAFEGHLTWPKSCEVEGRGSRHPA